MIEGLPEELRALGAALPPALRLATESVVLQRYQLARQMGMTYNGERDNYRILGYDSVISSQQYRELFRRGGIAKRVVTALPTAVWRGDGEMFEDENPEVRTPWEGEFFELNDRLGLWSKFKRAHILASLGSFSVLLLGAAGEFSTPLPRGTSTKDIWYVQPFAGGAINDERGVNGTSSQQVTSMFGADATVASWVEDNKDPRFGQPYTYNLRRTNVVAPELSRPVHWSRVVHVPSEGFLDDAIFGPPTLEAVWNYFCDLMKIVGGGGEASWLNMHPGMHLDIDKDMSFPGTTPAEIDASAKAQIDAMKVQADLYRHQLSRWLQTRGVKVTQLTSSPTDFGNNADTILKLIAGTSNIPLRILTGSELGELASTQDRDNWNDTVRDCRTGYAHPTLLRPFFGRLIDNGYMTKPKQWMPKWPDVGTLTQTEKAEGASKWMQINKDAGVTVFTENETREYWYGMGPLKPEDQRAWDRVRNADQLSINEKRLAVGAPAYDGDPAVDPQADVPFGLLPRETLRMTDAAVPPNAPGPPGVPPKLTAAEQKMIDKLETSLKDGGVVNIVVRK
jgi:hypothetical protein